MTQTELTVLAIYATIVAIWPIRWLVLDFILRRQVFLTPESPRYSAAEPPLVTAIVPAKDEEANIEQCLRSVVGLTYPRLEIVVVNDRSTDGTEAIASRLAAGEPRMRVLSIDHLPSGWTGKTHALDRAAAEARGQWLLFLDADTTHSPDSLSIMMEFARNHRAAMVTLLPELRCETFWEQVVQPVAGITLMQSFPLHTVNDDRSRLAFANGQYILIERSTYDAVDGHRSVRDRLLEDIALARQVKGLGLPVRVAMVKQLVTCRMYASLGQIVKGWSRIMCAALDHDAWRLFGKLLDPIVFCQSGHVALIVSLISLALGWHSTFASVLLALSVVHHILMFAVFRRVYAVGVPSPRFAAWFPVANLVVDVILARAIRMGLTGKVSWRGTAYGNTTNAVVPRANGANRSAPAHQPETGSKPVDHAKVN